MKYFTPQRYVEFNSDDADGADEKWNKPSPNTVST
jgi:hypothetical protein